MTDQTPPRTGAARRQWFAAREAERIAERDAARAKIAAGEMRECDYEFGPHDHDDVRCAATLDGMSGDDIAAAAEAYSGSLYADDTDHDYERYGRPRAA